MLRVVLLPAVGFSVGVFMTWLTVIVSPGWELPVWETVCAGFHSGIYGHEVEHAAEQYALFMFLAGGIGAIAAGLAVWLYGKRRMRKYTARHAGNGCEMRQNDGESVPNFAPEMRK
jgi:hypothetical protein